jgi:predicted AlkP superfamily phosphohydrolase/phosphomutase
MELRFSASPFISVYGMARFYLVSLAPKFELYMSPIAIDPSHVPPTVDISTPRPYSAHLAKEVGPYDTLGWSAPTNPVKDEKLSYDALLSYVWSYLRQRREMVIKELEKDDWACFCAVFEEPDHLSHMLWRFEDRQHPMYDENLAAKYGGELLKVYQYMDQIVAEVRARFAHRHTALIVVSDHGFKSFRRSVNINTWLAQNGYMALRGASPSMKLADLSDPTDAFFTNVDWARTRAYSMDLGKIFINLRGREPQGTVSPGPEYERLCQEIGQKFEKLTDPETGQPVVCKVYRREQIYQGPYVTDEADLIVGFNAGYRVSWQTCLGGMGEKAVEANRNAWSGDHCSLDPTQVPGIFFSNCKIDRQDISILDIAPTILEYFHQHARKPLDGRAFHLLRQ